MGWVSAKGGLAPRHVVLGQDVHRQLVGVAVEVCEQSVFEDGVVRGRGQKQSHAGPEFQMVRVAEDLLSAATVHVENQLRTLSKPGTEGRVLQIGFGLVE